ncbi:ABC transporter ATP-binding protein [Oceaniglobus ichthyenteri]|uniref:ABC transporter ATP-binding protein n=1 Tax=Oceaniglobus ichthyenteri TaxID=2136177 RepID=UPI000D3D452D|nr:ABC transporter ATP-binding protein [Oceaniglobus ichthyenteri]
MAGLTIDNVTKSFHAFQALKGVSIDVREGEFLAVLGPSGCGKTTLLRIIAGFEKVSAGEVRLGDKVVSSPDLNVAPENRRIGIVFQNYALWPHMSVAENIGYSLKIAKVAKPERERRVAEALKLVDMQGYGDRAPANLSGGQRQRVALARCLVATPELVLFDEPLANLDVHLRASMEDEFADFHKRTGTTIVYITHDQSEAMALADRIAVMDHGRLVQLDTPHKLYHEPATPMVASFISQGIVLPVTVSGAGADGTCAADLFGQPLTLRCRPGDGPRDGALACCRSEAVQVVEPGAPGFDGKIERVIYQGGLARIEFAPDAAPERIVHFVQPDPVTLKPGQSARLAFVGGWLIPEQDPA